MCSENNVLKWRTRFLLSAGGCMCLSGASLIGIGLGGMNKNSQYASKYYGMFLFTVIIGGLTISMGLVVCTTSYFRQKLFYEINVGILAGLMMLAAVLSIYSTVISIIFVIRLKGNLHYMMNDYVKSSDAKKKLDELQQEYECCGNEEPDDWKTREGDEFRYPESCFVDQKRNNEQYKYGCSPEIIEKEGSIIFGVAILGFVSFFAIGYPWTFLLFFMSKRAQHVPIVLYPQQPSDGTYIRDMPERFYIIN